MLVGIVTVEKDLISIQCVGLARKRGRKEGARKREEEGRRAGMGVRERKRGKEGRDGGEEREEEMER